MKTGSSNFPQTLFSLFLLPYHRLVSWLGLADLISREWEARLPSVVVAGMLLALYIWSAGFGLKSLYFVLVFATAAMVLILALNKA